MKISLGIFLSACVVILVALFAHGCWKMRSRQARPHSHHRNQTVNFFTTGRRSSHSTADNPRREESRRDPSFRPVRSSDTNLSHVVNIPLVDFRNNFSPASLSVSDDVAARTARRAGTTSFVDDVSARSAGMTRFDNDVSAKTTHPSSDAATTPLYLDFAARNDSCYRHSGTVPF